MLEQAVFRGTELLAQSPGFQEQSAAQSMIETLAVNANDPPGFYVHWWPKDVAAVVQSNGIMVHVLAVPGSLYRLVHDPFRLTREFPPQFTARGQLPALAWIHGRPEPRKLADVQRVLQEGDAPTLLGAAQALIDGGRIAFQRDQPDPNLIEQLWALLPNSNRGELSFATFVRNCALQFDLVVAQHVDRDRFPGYMTEQQAGDYPEGRYELALQMAVESNDEGQMQELFARRSGSQAMRLAWTMLLLAVGMGLAMRWIPWERLR